MEKTTSQGRASGDLLDEHVRNFEFGDYAIIEQKRHGVKNEMYLHKVIGRLRSSGYVDVPVQCPAIETNHSEIVEVVACVCCGADERKILRYRADDLIFPNA